MPHSIYRWIIVAAGGLLGCVAVGAMFSLPVFLRPISQQTGWSLTGVSTAMTIGFIAMALGSFAWGAVSDRIGTRSVVLIGSVLLAGSLALASQAQSLTGFQLLFGLAVGGSIGAIFAPTMALVTTWFDTHRGLAVSLVSAGMGMAPVVMSPLAARLVSTHDWRTAMLIIAGIAAGVMVPIALLLRPAPAMAEQGEGDATSSEGGMSLGAAMRSPQFLVLVLTNFFCCATHSGPIFHTVSYAVVCGIPLTTAVTIYSVEGLAGLGGRIAFGIGGDQFGAKRVLVFGLLVQAVAALGYLLASNLGVFYAVAALFGFIYAGVMPLYSVLIRENFPLRMMGTIMGGTAMAGGFGMATGPVLGGLIYDQYATYSWMFVASAVLGMGAFVIALTFKPVSRISSAQPLPVPGGTRA